MVAKKSLLLNELYFKANINEQFLLIDDNEEVKGLKDNPVIIPKKRVV